MTEFDASSFKVGVAPETLRKTNLGRYLFSQQLHVLTIQFFCVSLMACLTPSNNFT